MKYKLMTKTLGFMKSYDLYEELYICCEDLAVEGNYIARYMSENEDYEAIITVKYTVGRNKEYIKVFADDEYLMDLDMYMPTYAYNNPNYNEDDEDNMVETLKIIEIMVEEYKNTLPIR